MMKGFTILGKATNILGYIHIANFEITDINADMPHDNVAIRLQYTRNTEIVNNFFHDFESR
ncbi:MAG: hypothetical protein ACOX5R_23020 [bacterium]